MKKLVLATRNKDKVREIREKFTDLRLEILTLSDLAPIPPVDEDGRTIEENAVKKARTVFEYTGLPTLADDTGLEVDYLDGIPGVRSSRFAGEGARYSDNNRKLLQLMEGVPEEKRGARFRCVMALADGNGVITAQGICRGKILTGMRGQNGFGYDSIFFVPEYGKTFAEMTLTFKNKISHRGKALEKIKGIIQDKFVANNRTNP